jgi:hypothetical protein
MTDIHFATIEMNGRDQAILVSADVENGKVIDHICGRKCFSQICEGVEIRGAHDRVPTSQWLFTIWMMFPECSQRFAGNNVHFLINYRFGARRFATRATECFDRYMCGGCGVSNPSWQG